MTPETFQPFSRVRPAGLANSVLASRASAALALAVPSAAALCVPKR